MKKLHILFLLFTTSIANAQIPNYVPTNSLISWYPFTGNTADLSGNSNNGVNNGAVLTTDRFSSSNSAYQFNGANSYINVPSLSNLIYTPISISLWVNFSSLCSPLSSNCWQVLIGRDAAFNTSQGSLVLHNHQPNNLINKLIYHTGGGADITTITPTTNSWNHLVFIYENSTTKWFVNGVLTYSAAFAYNSNANIPFNIGSGGNRFYFNGILDDIGIWNRALSSCEIQQLYTASIATLNAASSASVSCAGQSLSLTASGANTYTWSTSQTGSNAIVSPTANTNYSVVGTTSAGCTPSAIVSVSVNSLPTLSIAGTTTLCAGQSINITASGANTYTWSNNSNNSSITISPTISSSYSVSGTSTAGCISASAAISNVTVYALPVITANSGSICNGQNFTISPSGANTYTIQGGTAVVSPSVNSSYSVSGTSTAGCISASAAISNVTVYALPVITANSGSICNGQNFTISPSGANTYTIQGGNAVVSPSVNSSYTVSGTSTAGCISASAAVATITVFALPQISVNSGTICNSQSFTLIPNGANTYTISGGNTIVSPTTTTSYSVTGTSTAGCISASAAVATVSVNQNPILSITGNTLLCTGETGTITVSGANAYAWSNGATSTSITINNTPNTYNYTVTGTGTNSCTASTTVQVLINACTSIAQNQNKYLDIYPNPASSLLNIGASDQAIGKTLKIFDAQSKLIQVLVLNTNNVLQLSDWAKGIYLIQVSELGISKRIVIE